MDRQLTAISLFSGIGAMDLAFSLAGFDILAQVEINDFCQKVLKKHAPKYWRNAAQFTDVRRVGGHNLPTADALFGGFPCQPHSVAGSKKGANDHRDLWGEFRRIIGEIRPRAILLENVPNIVNTIGTTVIGDLTALGYDARWGIISAADSGAPHRRERWWCVGYANSVRYNQPPTITDSHHDQQWHTETRKRERSAEFHATVTAGQNGSGTELGSTTIVGREADGQAFNTGAIEPELVINYQTNPPNRNNWRKAQPRMVRASDGITAGLDGFTGYPSRPGQQQFDYEPPRTVPDGITNRHDRVEALGNAVVWQVVYPLAEGIRKALSDD